MHWVAGKSKQAIIRPERSSLVQPPVMSRLLRKRLSRCRQWRLGLAWMHSFSASRWRQVSSSSPGAGETRSDAMLLWKDGVFFSRLPLCRFRVIFGRWEESTLRPSGNESGERGGLIVRRKTCYSQAAILFFVGGKHVTTRFGGKRVGLEPALGMTIHSKHENALRERTKTLLTQKTHFPHSQFSQCQTKNQFLPTANGENTWVNTSFGGFFVLPSVPLWRLSLTSRARLE